ncbi:PadR family transcriptional regulator [Bacillus sp. NP247]|nr:PadR family transcriptional regulator [Bacillus sp. NP247]
MYVDILLLAELTSGPKHGYEIKKNIQNRLGENFELIIIHFIPLFGASKIWVL